jgi:hypothetical protein
MSQGRGWNEENFSENPAVSHLERLGWTYVRPELFDAERESLKQVVLVPREDRLRFSVHTAHI